MATFMDQWRDLTPVPQDEGPDPVVQIAYEQEFVQQMDLFRAVIAKQEYSQRAFELTTSLLELNPASYTVWQYRRECLRHLNANLQEELDFMDMFASENPKNYQIWFHRRAVVEMLGDGHRELDFTNEVFEVDGKNYHAWAHRQWVIQRFHLWEGELEFTAQMIENDVRNNSAWNQRWWVVHSGPTPVTMETIDREIAFAVDSISKARKNESAWNYLRGIARIHPERAPQVVERCEEIVRLSESQNYLALGLLADLRESENTRASLERAKDLIESLVSVDAIRSKSWIRRLGKVLQELNN